MVRLADLPVEVFDAVRIDPFVWPRLACTCRFGRALAERQRAIHFPRLVGLQYSQRIWSAFQVAALVMVLRRWSSNADVVLRTYNCKKRKHKELSAAICRYDDLLSAVYDHVRDKVLGLPLGYNFEDAVGRLVSFWNRTREQDPWRGHNENIHDVKREFLITQDYLDAAERQILRATSGLQNTARTRFRFTPEYLCYTLHEYSLSADKRLWD